MSGFLQFILERKAQVIILTLEHLHLTGISVLMAIVVGVPAGVLITRIRPLARWVLGLANLIQTIPSLALLGFLLPLPLIGGIGTRPAIVALFLYSLLAIIRNTFTGIDQVDKNIKEAGLGMGMTNGQILTMIELPLAVPVIMAGIRISTVICVGIATLCAAIGAGGLGQFIFRGIAMVNNKMILTGAIPAAILALGLDALFHWIENYLKPKT